MVMSTIPIKYAVPTGRARTRLLMALAARYSGDTVRDWDVWDGLDTHSASQISGHFGYSFGKTRVVRRNQLTVIRDARWMRRWNMRRKAHNGYGGFWLMTIVI